MTKRNFETLEIGGHYRGEGGPVHGPIVKNTQTDETTNPKAYENYPFMCLCCKDWFSLVGNICDDEALNLIEKVDIVPCPMQGQKKCPRCNNADIFRCDLCNGKGYVNVAQEPTTEESSAVEVKEDEWEKKYLCHCNNSVRVYKNRSPYRCDRCQGLFASEQKDKLELLEKPIKLFVGAVCELGNGDIEMISSKKNGVYFFRNHTLAYPENGSPQGYPIRYQVIKVLNPQDETRCIFTFGN